MFKCPLIAKFGNQEVYLCLLVEHRSTTYQFVSIQLGGYIFDAYRKQLKNNEDPLIVVIPFLYYHGSDEWTPPEMTDLFELVPLSLKDYIPVFKILFENIQNYSDSQIRQLGSGLFTSALLTQKYSDRPDLLLERFSQIFSILGSWKDRNLFNTLVVYYIELVEAEEEEELNLLVEKIPDIMKTEFVSLADRLRETGRKEGMVKGEEKGIKRGMNIERERKNRTATENMLDKDFDVSTICDVLEVTLEFVEKVRKSMKDQDK